MSQLHRPRGTSMIEVMVAGAVLLVGLVGVLAALQRAAVEARLGQNRQQKVMLADAVLQRIRLQDKNTFFNPVPALPAQPAFDITKVQPGASPWKLDPTSNLDPMDLSMGAFFRILPDGTITPVSPASIGNPANCGAVPVGYVCREVFTHLGAPLGSPGVTATSVATTWVRITRKTTENQPAETDVVMNQVVIQ
ncbi:MAG: hypothetical protein ACOZQL_12955 [Myxococcota bacterium]